MKMGESNMKKRIILLLSFTCLLSACGKESTIIEKEVAVSEETAQAENPEVIEVDKNLLSVEVTVPEKWMGDGEISQEEVEAIALEKGYENAILNADGSVTYKMSKRKHQEILDEMKQGIEDSCNEMINGEDAVESFQKIEFNDSLTEFSVYVDSSKFGNFDTFNSFVFYMTGAYYQIFNCVPSDKLDVKVDYIDKDTNDILSSGKMSDAKTSSKEPDDVISEIDAIKEVENWYIGDVWNNFVDFASYREDGLDCTGSEIDIDFAYSQFKKKYELKEKYDTFIASLPDDYTELKESWNKMSEQISLIYNDLEVNGVVQGGPPLNLSLLEQYSDVFEEQVYSLDK